MILTARTIINKRKDLWSRYKNIEKDTDFREALAQKLIESGSKALRDEIYNNPEYLIEMFFVIVSKDQEIMPFFLNNVQQIFLDRLNSDIEKYQNGELTHLKYLVLKGRQQGFTSFITAYQLACTVVRKNFSGFTVADSSDNTNTIFEDKAKFPYSLLPEQIKPSEKYNTRKEMLFEKLNSKWRCATAGNKEIGRSKTINFMHGSEVAFWKDPQSIIGGLGQALTKDSITILETTANGFNQYRSWWVESENGENNFTPLFFEWWLTPEYTLNFPNKFAEEEFKQKVLNPRNEWEEKLNWLLTEKKLKWEQLYWYEGKKRDLRELLPQEYPVNAMESFLSSGSPIFNNEIVLKRLDAIEQYYKVSAPLIGRFTYRYENQMIVDSSIKFVEDPNGTVIIYQRPIAYTPYVIGADTSESFAKNRDSDYCVGQVINNTNGVQVATIRGRFDTDIFAKNLYCLGKYYGTLNGCPRNSLIAIETNFDLHPVKELSRLGYDNQYIRETADTIGTQIQVKYGFHTSTMNRNMIISNLVEIVREHIEVINDISTLKEMLVFADVDGKPQASEGHDDCVMSLAITYAVRKQMPYTSMIEEQTKSIYDKLPRALISDTDLEEEDDSIW